MKKRYKKITALALSTVMVGMYAQPVLAAEENTEKEENVYVNLREDGSVEKIYVVNSYHMDTAGDILDYGTYDSVKNLTSDTKIEQKNDTITAEAAKGKFNYQGDMKSKDMPWDISIDYKLDGAEISAEELAGKSGALTITLSTKQNRKVDTSFFDNYLLQATIALDTERCSNIRAEGSTEANVGNDKQLLYNIMAGQEKEMVIMADVKDFEMDAISFKAVPASFDLDSSSVDMSELTDKTAELSDATMTLNDGAKELLNGSETLQNGLQEYAGGVDAVYAGADSLLEGISTLKGGISSYAEGTAQVDSGVNTLAEKTAGMPVMVSRLTDAVSQLEEGSTNLTDAENWTKIEQ